MLGLIFVKNVQYLLRKYNLHFSGIFENCTFLPILIAAKNMVKMCKKFHFADAHFYQKIGLGGLRTRYKGKSCRFFDVVTLCTFFT